MDLDTIKEIWIHLLNRSAYQYFMSWSWVSTWINTLPSDSKIQLHVAYQQDRPLVAFFLGQRNIRKYGILPSRLLSLNSTGDSYYDVLYIEYNSVLYDSSTNLDIDNILNYIFNLDWDELMFPGMSEKFVTDFNLLDKARKLKYNLLVEHVDSSFFVNLQKIRDAEMGFLKTLSSNRRSQLRRSLKQYEMNGLIHIHEAASTDEALVMLDELVRLHQHEWKQRGWPGLFSNQYFYQFHKNLIHAGYEKGEIQLLHFYTDQIEIGYVYCFIHHKTVLFYQSGFQYQLENNFRPGLVSHYLAVLYNANKNMDLYDFWQVTQHTSVPCHQTQPLCIGLDFTKIDVDILLKKKF
ncbi:MAG: GNAT family N-acetyltransferase [Anaerolineales bacterium]|nr:GNAT family N-acetyltransferase [Anaerolineales bacterium]